ncbi:MAG: hypothetical protein VX014_05565, partial [Verrucomicrobiota bacterium]|nr:hypothetical protein [Verrucomicrobiota bacterium]
MNLHLAVLKFVPHRPIIITFAVFHFNLRGNYFTGDTLGDFAIDFTKDRITLDKVTSKIGNSALLYSGYFDIGKKGKGFNLEVSSKNFNSSAMQVILAKNHKD